MQFQGEAHLAQGLTLLGSPARKSSKLPRRAKTVSFFSFLAQIQNCFETTEIMEKKMETTITYWGDIGG